MALRREGRDADPGDRISVQYGRDRMDHAVLCDSRGVSGQMEELCVRAAARAAVGHVPAGAGDCWTVYLSSRV